MNTLPVHRITDAVAPTSTAKSPLKGRQQRRELDAIDHATVRGLAVARGAANVGAATTAANAMIAAAAESHLTKLVEHRINCAERIGQALLTVADGGVVESLAVPIASDAMEDLRREGRANARRIGDCARDHML
jgi:hypothetical protein